MNIELMVRVMNHILEHPETWDLTAWHCETSHCFLGHAQIMSGIPQSLNAHEDGKRELGLSQEDAIWLSSSSRTLLELHDFVSAAASGTSYFDLSGYDRSGYDLSGYDLSGYDRSGYNRSGYNRSGRDRSGYDRSGRDRLGRDRSGNTLPLIVYTPQDKGAK